MKTADSGQPEQWQQFISLEEEDRLLQSRSSSGTNTETGSDVSYVRNVIILQRIVQT